MFQVSCDCVPSPIFPNEYLVCSDGRVLSKRSNKVLRPATDKYGYHYYVLCVKGNRRTVKAHRLVATAFIPNTHNKPTVNHKNGKKTDNRIENLEWATNSEQSNDPLTLSHLRAAHDKEYFRRIGSLRDFGRKNVVVAINGEKTTYPSLLSAAESLGENYAKLSEIINGKRAQKKHFTIKWASEIDEFCIAVTKKRIGED